MSDQVDILLATYNGAKYLEQQLESIWAQTHSDFHVVVRDDRSTDQTATIIQKWAKAHQGKLTLLPSTERLGVIGNFSELMKHSRSPYILFADQDDVWLPHKIEVSLNRLKKMETAHGSHKPLAVHTDLTVVDSHLNVISPSFWQYACLNPALASLNRILPQNVVTGCTLLMNRALLQLATPIPPTAAMHDWWIALVAICFGHLEFLSHSTILYRQHGRNDTGAKPYSLWYHLKHFRTAQTPVKTYRQASHFLERFHNVLPQDKKESLAAYAELETLPFLRRISQIFKYRFFKQGFLRNAKLFFNY